MARRKNFPGNVERKQKEAAERQAEYSKFTNEQKLARLDRANLTATSERAKLAARILRAKATKIVDELLVVAKTGSEADLTEAVRKVYKKHK